MKNEFNFKLGEIYKGNDTAYGKVFKAVLKDNDVYEITYNDEIKKYSYDRVREALIQEFWVLVK